MIEPSNIESINRDTFRLTVKCRSTDTLVTAHNVYYVKL